MQHLTGVDNQQLANGRLGQRQPKQQKKTTGGQEGALYLPRGVGVTIEEENQTYK